MECGKVNKYEKMLHQVGLIMKIEDQILYFVEWAKNKTSLHVLLDDLKLMK